MEEKMERKSTKVLTLGITAGLATVLSGCSGEDMGTTVNEDYARICRDNSSEERIDDRECDTSSHNSHAGWYFLPLYMNSGRDIPAVGSKATEGETKLPAGKSYNSSIPREGSKVSSGSKNAASKPGVSRGGFGSKGGGAGS